MSTPLTMPYGLPDKAAQWNKCTD